MYLILSLALMTGAATVKGRVSISADGAAKSDGSNVVVYLEDLTEPPPVPKKGPPLRIAQRNLQFEPAINVVVVGSVIEFPNEDKIYHNVFSVSDASKFDLGLYRAGEMKAVTMQEPGVVDVYCNIHPEMVAKVKVLDTSFYAVTDASGAFTITDVPPGTHTLVAWQAFGEEVRSEVTVAKDGSPAPLALKLIEGTKKKRHLRKDGTPYGRYK